MGCHVRRPIWRPSPCPDPAAGGRVTSISPEAEGASQAEEAAPQGVVGQGGACEVAASPSARQQPTVHIPGALCCRYLSPSMGAVVSWSACWTRPGARMAGRVSFAALALCWCCWCRAPSKQSTDQARTPLLNGFQARPCCLRCHAEGGELSVTLRNLSLPTACTLRFPPLR